MVKRRGPKPTPAPLRLVTDTHRPDRHGLHQTARDAAEQAQGAFGTPEMPAHFEGEAAKAWDRYITPAWWLDRSREPAAIILCELWAEHRNDPGGFPAAKHTQLRAYLAELGLTEERNRFGTGRRNTGDEFFDGD